MPLRTRVLPTPRKAKPRNSSLKRREAERREAHHRAASKSDAARVLSPFLLAEEPRPRGPHGAGALAFRRPTAASEVLASARLRPRFLEPPDANGRTLSGTSAASTSRSGTRRTGRCPSRPRARCMGRARREPLPLRLKEYPRERRPFASGMVGM